MLVPEEFVDEVADVILNDVEESDARDSNISRFKLVVNSIKDPIFRLQIYLINWHLLYVSGL